MGGLLLWSDCVCFSVVCVYIYNDLVSVVERNVYCQYSVVPCLYRGVSDNVGVRIVCAVCL